MVLSAYSLKRNYYAYYHSSAFFRAVCGEGTIEALSKALQTSDYSWLKDVRKTSNFVATDFITVKRGLFIDKLKKGGILATMMKKNVEI